MDLTQLYERFKTSKGVATDTRQNLDGFLFFCLKGPHFDANSFALEALLKGAVHVVSDLDDYRNHPDITVVDDTLMALQELAKHHRKNFGFPVIGLTGSNGKTTNKELIAAVLSKKYLTYATRGNLNNHIGVPLTLLEIPLHAQMAIIEMGANHQGEIRLLSSICDPDYGMITNIGKAHLEGFGGLEGVKKGKKELYDHLYQKNAHIFVNADDPLLLELSNGFNRTLYGTAPQNYISGELIHSEPFVAMRYKAPGQREMGPPLQSKLVGAYNFYNILAAITIGHFFDVVDAEIFDAIASYTPSNNRSQFLDTGRNLVFLDAYNANPSSMEVAIENLAKQEHPKKIALLGQMMELGDDTPKEHEGIVKRLTEHNIEAMLVGPYYKGVNGPYTVFDSSSELLEHLKTHPLSGFQILIKGSRATKMESVLDAL